MVLVEEFNRNYDDDLRRHSFTRLLTFNDFPKSATLSITILTDIGFYFDHTSCSIKCSECKYEYSDLTQPSCVSVICEHVKTSGVNCSFTNKQIVYLMQRIDEMKANARQQKEKYSNIEEDKNIELGMDDASNREKTFKKLDLKLFPKDLAANGFFVHKDFCHENNQPVEIDNLMKNVRRVKICCYSCDYDCFIFERHDLNHRYQSPFIEHLKKSPNCKVFSGQEIIKEETRVVVVNPVLAELREEHHSNEWLVSLIDLLSSMSGVYDCLVNDLIEKFFKPKKVKPTRMSRASERKKTLVSFQAKLKFDIGELAEKGLYVSQVSNHMANGVSHFELTCYYCNYKCVIFEKYELNSHFKSPFTEHFELHPTCAVFQKGDSDKKSLKTTVSVNQKLPLKSIQYNGDFEQLKAVINKTAHATCNKPYNAEYAMEQSRIDSFRGWPTNMTQQPADLVRAGFYYYGTKDMVKCFFCNGGIRNWDAGEDPLVEHARWFPKCGYVKLLKGAEFIEEVRVRYQDMDSGFSDDFVDDVSTSNQYYDLNDGVGGKKRSLSPRTLNSRLDLPSVRKIMKNLKIKRNTIKCAIEKKLLKDGVDYENIVDLVRVCCENEEYSKQLQKQVKETFDLYVSNLPQEITDENVEHLLFKKFDVKAAGIQRFSGKINKSEDIVLINLKSEDSKKLNLIENELNNKVFPGSKSDNRIIVKRTNDVTAVVADSATTATTTTTSVDREQTKLEEEKEKLKRERRCNICMDRYKNIIFMPCAHLSACVECSVSCVQCPVCRTNVLATIRTYSS